jgi:predicted peptidase
MPVLDRSAFGLNTRIILPDAPTPGPLPAILFLHGRGQSGTDGSQIDIGLPAQALGKPQDWPFLIVCPQKPDFDRLWPDFRDELAGVLDAVEREFQPDSTRRTLTGLSQGGNGSLVLAKALPWRFAAVAAVCGWADPRQAARELAGTPLWLFHGADDAVVPASCSAAVADWMTGPDRPLPAPRLTLYPGVGHNSWEAAYAEPELPSWLLSHGANGQA